MTSLETINYGVIAERLSRVSAFFALGFSIRESMEAVYGKGGVP